MRRAAPTLLKPMTLVNFPRRDLAAQCGAWTFLSPRSARLANPEQTIGEPRRYL